MLLSAFEIHFKGVDILRSLIKLRPIDHQENLKTNGGN